MHKPPHEGSQDQRASPLACLLRLELETGIGTAEGVTFSSFFGDPNMDSRDERLDVVRGSLLLAATLYPLPKPTVAVEPLPSRLVGLNGIDPLMPFRCLLSLVLKYPFDCVDRLLVGVGGIDWLPIKLGGVVLVLVARVRLAVRRLLPLIPSFSFSSHDLTSSPAMFRTNTAGSCTTSR